MVKEVTNNGSTATGVFHDDAKSSTVQEYGVKDSKGTSIHFFIFLFSFLFFSFFVGGGGGGGGEDWKGTYLIN